VGIIKEEKGEEHLIFSNTYDTINDYKLILSIVCPQVFTMVTYLERIKMLNGSKWIESE